MSWTIPKFARNIWGNEPRENVNAGLAFHRFFELQNDDPKTRPGLHNMTKIDLSQQCLHLLERRARQVEAIESGGDGWKAKRWIQKTGSRLVCGLGIPSLCNNGMLLDRISGAPYLPGTALKGVAKDYALDVLDDLPEAKKQEMKEKIMAVFGAVHREQSGRSQEAWESARGHVIFFDAFADVSRGGGGKPFEIDIINPHYGEYYSKSGAVAPADYLAPVPCQFLTVKQGMHFQFALAAREAMFEVRDEKEKLVSILCEAEELLDAAADWLQKALHVAGIGGKTRVGYGVFDELPETEES